jgi:hypothetical protein
MNPHTIELLEHNALFNEHITDLELEAWIDAHITIMNKKSLIGF